MIPLKELLTYSKIIKKKFNPNFHTLNHCVEIIAFFVEFYHYLKRNNLKMYKSELYVQNYWERVKDIEGRFQGKMKKASEYLNKIKVS